MYCLFQLNVCRWGVNLCLFQIFLLHYFEKDFDIDVDSDSDSGSSFDFGFEFCFQRFLWSLLANNCLELLEFGASDFHEVQWNVIRFFTKYVKRWSEVKCKAKVWRLEVVKLQGVSKVCMQLILTCSLGTLGAVYRSVGSRNFLLWTRKRTSSQILIIAVMLGNLSRFDSDWS